jgi:hypothetical protein
LSSICRRINQCLANRLSANSHVGESTAGLQDPQTYRNVFEDKKSVLTQLDCAY